MKVASRRRRHGAIGLAPVALAVGLLGCGGREAPAAPPRPPPPSPGPGAAPAPVVLGTVDVRPFAATVAYARRRPTTPSEANLVDILVYDRPVPPEIGCTHEGLRLEDTQRYIQVQMPWPAPAGSVWRSDTRAVPAESAGIFFHVGRGLGGSGQRALGYVRVVAATARDGTLEIDAGTPNETGGVHGMIRGAFSFSVCP